MSTIIKVENLGKRYILSHQEQERYTALRDVLANKVKVACKKLLHPFASSSSPFTDSTKEEFWALKDVSFDIKQGDRVGIIGRNGAGKSTLLKVLSRITEPTQGRVTINGRVASLLEVGTGFHPELTGRENIYLNGAILGMTKADIKRKFDEIVAFAEVEKFLDTPVKRYSSGMYVRLAFAVAAHLEPEILIVDEVLAVGDAQFQKKCLGKMEEVGKEGRTVLFVSHNMEAIKYLCTKAIWLRSGEMVGQGDVAEQIERYLNSDQKNINISSNASIIFGSGLELRRFEFEPNPIESGKVQKFALELWSSAPVRVDAITILIYSCLGMRLAVMDLRQPSGAYQLDGVSPLTLNGEIEALPLVEGEYHVGLYVSGEDIHDNFLDLVDITVTGKRPENEIVPYPANVRGVVELNYKFNL